jgi:hypothetical protein
MFNHDDYRRLCEGATESQTSPEELASMLCHVAECEPCRQTYEEALRDREKEVEEPLLIPDLQHQDRYRRRFLKRAKAEGLQFSSAIEHGKSPRESVPNLHFKPRYVFATAMAILIVLFGARTYHWKSRQGETAARMEEFRARNADLQRMNGQLKAELSSAGMQQEAIDRKFSELTDQIASGERERTSTLARMEELQVRLNQAKTDIRNLSSSAEEQKTLNRQLQQQAERVAEMTGEIQKLRTLASNDEATLAARGAEVDRLTSDLKAQRGSVERENRLLAVDRDVRELMGARNLHIVDIHDADAEGKDTKAFGRVFYTEGKSLIFYAFDLDHPKVSKSNVAFVGWGTNSNAQDSFKELGIFYVDDAAQRRWVLKVDDPETLKEINAVFVSVEPSSRAAKRPTGQKLLYAYLSTRANHP